MALTATATKSTHRHVCRLLGMIHPFIVSVSPNRMNIKFTLKNAKEMEETFEPLVEELRRCRASMGKVIIFCRSYDDCSHIYLFIKSKLGAEMFEPIGAPDLAPFRLMDMFTACTHPSVKDDVLKSFCDCEWKSWKRWSSFRSYTIQHSKYTKQIHRRTYEKLRKE